MFNRFVTIAASVLLLVVSACSSDSSTGGNENADASANENKSETFDEDLPVAQAAVLTLDDLPVGWSSKPRDENDGEFDEFDEKLADCAGVPVEEITEPSNPKAESETFVDGNDIEIEASVVIAPTVDEALQDFEFATSADYLECVRSVMPAVMEQAAEDEGGDVEITEATVGPLRIEESGERSAAVRISITVAAEGLSVDLYIDILFAQVGRATMQVSTQSVLSTPDVDFAQSLLDLMVGRIDEIAVS